MKSSPAILFSVSVFIVSIFLENFGSFAVLWGEGRDMTYFTHLPRIFTIFVEQSDFHFISLDFSVRFYCAQSYCWWSKIISSMSRVLFWKKVWSSFDNTIKTDAFWIAKQQPTLSTHGFIIKKYDFFSKTEKVIFELKMSTSRMVWFKNTFLSRQKQSMLTSIYVKTKTFTRWLPWRSWVRVSED